MAVGARLLTTLPPEILLLISERLTAFELIRLSRTCRTLSHFGGCKSVAKAFVRYESAGSAIFILRKKVNRMDLVVELFRHVKDRKANYPTAAFAASRLNDIKQLEEWRAEFGSIPAFALMGAVLSNRIETFDFVFSHADHSDDTVENVFGTIGESGNRALLDHLIKKCPEWVSPESLGTIIESSARHGHLDLALEIFDCLPPRCGKIVIDSAVEIATGAAEAGNHAVFSEFIDMYKYDAECRNDIAACAASFNHVDIMRRQEESVNSAPSFGEALDEAVDSNSFEAVQFLLGNEALIRNRITTDDVFDALLSATRTSIYGPRRADLISLLITRAPREALLHAAADSHSFDQAVVLLKRYQMNGNRRRSAAMRRLIFGVYSNDIPDWKMTVRLIIISIDFSARSAKSKICEVEQAHFLRVLPGAIDLARELNLGEGCIDKMSLFAKRTLE